MLDAYLADFHRIEARGGVFLIKFDGERESRRRTVLVSMPGSDWFFRGDADNLEQLLIDAIIAFDTEFPEASKP